MSKVDEKKSEKIVELLCTLTEQKKVKWQRPSKNRDFFRAYILGGYGAFTYDMLRPIKVEIIKTSDMEWFDFTIAIAREESIYFSTVHCFNTAKKLWDLIENADPYTGPLDTVDEILEVLTKCVERL